MKYIEGEQEFALTDPDTLRYRIRHLPARLVRHAGKKILKISPDRPGKDEFLTCRQRLSTLPAFTGPASTIRVTQKEEQPGVVGAGARPGTTWQPRLPATRRQTDMKIKNRRQHEQ